MKTNVIEEHNRAIERAFANNDTPPDFDLLDLAETIELAARRIERALLLIADAARDANDDVTYEVPLRTFDGDKFN